MIIVFLDDQTVEVLPDIDAARSEYEAIDVEEGTYNFFDDYGRRLIPRITTPVRRTSLPFGVKLVGGGDFDLELDREDRGAAFDSLLANTVAIERNPKFATLADLADYVARKRRERSAS